MLSHTTVHDDVQKALGQRQEASVGLQPLVNQLSHMFAAACTAGRLQEGGKTLQTSVTLQSLDMSHVLSCCVTLAYVTSNYVS